MISAIQLFFSAIIILLLTTCSDKELVSQSQDQIIYDSSVEIYLLSDLDEPRGFCLDIRGYKSSANIDRGLQAHTCYSYQGSVAVDQGFEHKKLNDNTFYIPGFNVCMEVERAEAGSSLILKACSDTQPQKFIFNDSGTIVLASNEDLCLSISQQDSKEGGGGNPIHLIRDISMENCETSLKSYQIWGVRIN